MKTITITIAMLILAVAANAQTPPATGLWRANGPMTWVATSACVGGQSADIVSSTGYEGNSFLRGSNGKMNMGKAIPLKLGLCIAPLVFEKKMSREARIAVRIGQFVGGGVAAYYAAKNWSRR